MDLPYLEQPELHTRSQHRAALLQYPGNFREALQQAKSDPQKTLFGAAHGIPSTYVTKVRTQACNSCFHETHEP
jgi:4-hydroxy-2-oxoheptanedioate aldolase